MSMCSAKSKYWRGVWSEVFAGQQERGEIQSIGGARNEFLLFGNAESGGIERRSGSGEVRETEMR